MYVDEKDHLKVVTIIIHHSMNRSCMRIVMCADLIHKCRIQGYDVRLSYRRF